MAKGGSYEREIARVLSLWWTNGEREDVFYRSQGSGGRFTSRQKKGKDTAMQAGDMTASDSVGEPLIKKWSIEVKTGYGTKKKIKDKDGDVVKNDINRWDVLDFLDSRQTTPVLEKMWAQCSRDANLSNRIPILIFRRNGRSSCIMIHEIYYTILEKWFGKYYGDYVKASVSNFICIILPLNNFLEWIPDVRAAL